MTSLCKTLQHAVEYAHTPDWHRHSQGDGDAGFVGNNKLFAFSTAVFTSWDFHLTDWEAARNLRSSIQVQVSL